MDTTSREQTELLRNIWNEMKALGQNLGARIDKTNARLDETNARLDETNARLELVAAGLEKVEHKVERVADEQHVMARYLGDLTTRHEVLLDELRERVTRLESKR